MTDNTAPQPRRPVAATTDKRPPAKSASAFRTISEVAEELEVPQHVLRFWESKFSTVRPLKRGGGRRYYRPEDIELIRRIRNLLYSDGYTIKGVQRLMREGQLKSKLAPGTARAPEAPAAPPRAAGELQALIAELSELRDMLRGAVD